MHHHHRRLRLGPLAWMSTGVAGAALVMAGPAPAQDGLPYSPRIPIPRPMLDFEPPGDARASGKPDSASDASAALLEPDLTGLAAQAVTSNAHGQARAPIPVDIIRKGFAARSTMVGALPERSVGFKLGADIFSVSTKLTAPPGDERGRDARIDWRLARPIANAGPGFIWTISTGGGSGVVGNPEQNANLLVGYRHQLFEHLTMTSQLSMGGNYVFAPGDGPHSTLVPEVKLSANLAALADLPWEASLDVALARQMPLVASDFETRGTAMLRLKYNLE
ncbi:hypothetical protein [Bosea vaviloviae]|uniref:Uncharacterized protein n=1 Tax=Bosea vaviloviae TaxID=1526658 RepID=A0A1D7U705_9HYPH|nr:hypothetical protein [Bosea vaviloviae]AOO83165.1 hypothetical protein BHK69_24395 [Bosea vaviloviae]